jgi:hypothetical protein
MSIYDPVQYQPPVTAAELHEAAAVLEREAILIGFGNAQDPAHDPVAWALYRERLQRARDALRQAAEAYSL